MASCKDCVCCEPCGQQERLVQIDDHTWEAYEELDDVEKHCPHFKSKADYQEVKHGHWKPNGRCSRCEAFSVSNGADFCSNCGAMMDEEVNEE